MCHDIIMFTLNLSKTKYYQIPNAGRKLDVKTFRRSSLKVYARSIYILCPWGECLPFPHVTLHSPYLTSQEYTGGHSPMSHSLEFRSGSVRLAHSDWPTATSEPTS